MKASRAAEKGQTVPRKRGEPIMVKRPKPKKWKENEARFRELILYISQKCADDSTFGSVKLNKILFFSDFLTYAEFGEPITGFVYQKLANGPAPKRLLPIRNDMIEKGDLGLQEVRRGARVQKRTVNLRKPNLSVFTPQQISIVDVVIDELWGKEAWAVSDLSHGMMSWVVADDKGEIPYETVFLSNDPLTEIDIQRGKEIAKEHGLLKR